MKRFLYSLLTYRLDQVWFPAGLWALFIIIILLMRENGEQALNSARAYLGAVLPLTAGIMAAYAVLDDPALELRFTTPIPAWKTLAERLAMTLAITAVGALLYQLVLLPVGISLAAFGNLWAVQLLWLVPVLALMALGCLASLSFAHNTGGAMIVALVWLLQLLFRDWFILHRWARYLLVFLAMLRPDHPDLILNQLVLVLLAALFILFAQALFKKQERYL